MQYKIKKGDTLSAISRKLGISVKDLASANKIKDVNKIQAGASLIIPQPKNKKSSAVEKVIPQTKKEIKSKQKSKVKKKKESILPINVRQFFNPNEDRTQEDFSESELKALREVIDYSQSEERRADKISRNVNPNQLEYSDYNAMTGVSAGDSAQLNSTGSIFNKVTNPYAVLKTTLGKATVNQNEDGTYQVTDKFDFKPKTDSTGLSKLSEYAQSISEQGFNPYGQLRNYMGYYGPQEGTGQGGNMNITAANGGLINYAKGGQMDIKQQTQNVANQGRYGDSMLLHVNPAEVKGLAQAMPITVNPETGQPEAFLPFLAPILGGMAGSALLTGAGATAAGAGILGTAGLSSALATGIGAGLATYAETGGSGSKALMSMLTGYGGAKAAELAGGAAASSADIATNTGNLTTELSANLAQDPNMLAQLPFTGPLPQGAPLPELGNLGNMELQKQLAGFQPALQQSGANAADAFYAGADGFRPDLGDSLKQAFSGDGGYPEGFGNLLTGATNTSSYLPMSIGVGGRGIMESQDAFERQNQQMILDDEERKRQMYLDNPEIQLYSASGGMTQFQGGGGTDNYDSESGKQVYAPVKQQYEVNPNFMAGFAPETMYFRPDTINAPATNTRGGSRPTLGPDTYTGTKGGYDYEGTVDAEGNYVPGKAQGVQFAPQTAIDPYAAFTGMTPDGVTSLSPLQGLVQSSYNPYPVQPMSMSPTDDTSDYSNVGGGDGGVGVSDDATDSDGNPLTGSPYNQYDPQAVADVREEYKDYFFDYDDIQDFYRDEVQGVMDRKTGGDTNMPNKGLEALNKVAPEVVDKIGYQEGGQTDPLIQEVTMFILGESDNEQIVNQFVDKYGVEAFTQLREQILQSLVPNAQTSGLIEGIGNGGMDDDIMGTIGNKEKIAVSQDEFIVPADVVSMLGDGSSDAGSKQLYDMMDRVRQEKTGTTEQAPKLANAGGMLPA
jgi:hypothetical protein